jgi:type II restriction enzyme
MAEALPPQPPKKTLSEGLSDRLTKHYEDGHKLINDSKPSEKNLSEAIEEIMAYLKDKYHYLHATFEVRPTITLYDCEKYQQEKWGVEPNPEHEKAFMRPDGGLIVMKLNGSDIPILITEDKVQGTNDKKKVKGSTKKPQSTGNAIERSAKNIRGAEMIFCESDVFPYVIFGSGCDLHHTETISHRLVMMNYGNPIHYIDITSDSTDELIDEKIDSMIANLSIQKQQGRAVASFFIKGHKWDECEHGASAWTKPQRVKVLKKVVDLALESVLKN